jgi:hypothetical protein
VSGYNEVYARAVLAAIGAPQSTVNIRRLNAWNQAEGGPATAANNAFNTTIDFGANSFFNTFYGAHGAGPYHVRNYGSQAQGIAATVATIQGDPKRYAPIVAALKNPSSTDYQFAHAVGASGWGTNGNLIAQILHAGPAPVPKGTASVAYSGSTAGGATAGAATGSAAAAAQGPCRFSVTMPSLGPIGGGSVCMDKAVGILAMGGSTLLLFGGFAVIAAAVLQGTSAGKAAQTAAGVIPVGRVANQVKAGRAVKAKARAKATAAKAAEPAEGYADEGQVQHTRSQLAQQKSAGTSRAQERYRLQAMAKDRGLKPTTGGPRGRTVSRSSSRPGSTEGATRRRVATREEAGF